MSHPDPRHDAENERGDDDLLRAEDEARRREDEQAAIAESLRIAAYADARMIRRGDWESWYDGRGDVAPDGRPLNIGTHTYETWTGMGNDK